MICLEKKGPFIDKETYEFHSRKQKTGMWFVKRFIFNQMTFSDAESEQITFSIICAENKAHFQMQNQNKSHRFQI